MAEDCDQAWVHTGQGANLLRRVLSWPSAWVVQGRGRGTRSEVGGANKGGYGREQTAKGVYTVYPTRGACQQYVTLGIVGRERGI